MKCHRSADYFRKKEREVPGTLINGPFVVNQGETESFLVFKEGKKDWADILY